MRDPTGSSLPQELEFIVINNLSDNKPALASCSLVCSRWLPPSRRHLFRDITLEPTMNRNPERDPFAEFFKALEGSPGENMEWAIGPCIRKFTLDGNVAAWDLVFTCPLSLLCTLLSRLPHLASLTIEAVVVSDDLSESHAEQGKVNRFELDELVLEECPLQDQDDPRHVLALLSKFSVIRSLTVGNWWVWDQNAMPTFSTEAFSPPLVHSLTIRWVHAVPARALYAFLSGSTSPTIGSLTHISLFGTCAEDFVAFSGFTRIPGPTIRHVKLYVVPRLPGLLDVFGGISLETCTALHSLILGIHPLVANDTRELLTVYADFFHRHCYVFRVLTVVRLEMRSEGLEMLNAFMRTVQDTFPEWHGAAVQTVSDEEAEQNRDTWAALDIALCDLPALERVEFVLHVLPHHNEILTEEARGELRSAFEGRLPRLWPSGVVQLMFEAVEFGDDPN